MSLNVPHILTFPDYPIDYPTFLVIILDKLLSHSITVWADLLQLKLIFLLDENFQLYKNNECITFQKVICDR